jgi:hypothetical protein
MGCSMYIIRHVVGTGPRRCIFNVIVSRHVFCQNSNLVGRVLREQIRSSQARHTGPNLQVSERLNAPFAAELEGLTPKPRCCLLPFCVSLSFPNVDLLSRR